MVLVEHVRQCFVMNLVADMASTGHEFVQHYQPDRRPIVYRYLRRLPENGARNCLKTDGQDYDDLKSGGSFQYSHFVPARSDAGEAPDARERTILDVPIQYRLRID
jgi:hypothetical protein